ncbi:hypothetical protein NIES4071_57970 [Calothrix sp. NIES-4071]|nr:hypothetical protein NIES4071_57970 [Calothrix sp. NIES-4071]BAZ60104.1 hypothetical protein NIES4105_57920 [Calothrix sp. NIES-4105]
MADVSNVKLIIGFNDPDLDDEEKNEQAQRLLQEIRELDEVEAAEPLLDPNPPAGNKSFGGILAGFLMAEVSPANLKKLFGFVSDRLGNKPMKLKIKAADGRELEIEASSKEEFEYIKQQAEEFINKQ